MSLVCMPEVHNMQLLVGTLWDHHLVLQMVRKIQDVNLSYWSSLLNKQFIQRGWQSKQIPKQFLVSPACTARHWLTLLCSQEKQKQFQQVLVLRVRFFLFVFHLAERWKEFVFHSRERKVTLLSPGLVHTDKDLIWLGKNVDSANGLQSHER